MKEKWSKTPGEKPYKRQPPVEVTAPYNPDETK